MNMLGKPTDEQIASAAAPGKRDDSAGSVHTYRGQKLEDMSREQLIDAVVDLGKMLNDRLRERRL